MINRPKHRLSLCDVLIYVHCTEKPQRVTDYRHLLPERFANMGFDAFQKEIREAYASLASLGRMRRFRTPDVKGYQFAITDRGREFFDLYNEE